VTPNANPNSGYFNGATAISPLHVIYASHWPHSIGQVFYFITADNQVVTRTLVDFEALPGDWTSTDTIVGKLDAALPATITPARMLPATFRDYVVQIRFGVPSIRISQQERAVVEEWVADNYIASTETQKLAWFGIQKDSRLPYHQPTVAGDSGSPVYVIINSEAVLLSLTSGLNSGPGFYSFLDDINGLMTSLGGGYQLQTVDLSGYTDFSA
jgi:hypothetical protein